MRAKPRTQEDAKKIETKTALKTMLKAAIRLCAFAKLKIATLTASVSVIKMDSNAKFVEVKPTTGCVWIKMITENPKHVRKERFARTLLTVK